MIESDAIQGMAKLAIKRTLDGLSSKQLTRRSLNDIASSCYLQGAYDMATAIMDRWPEVVAIVNDPFKEGGAGI